ncbi:sugar transferase [Paeniglutamicibacter cryotolerans]|uniref:Exopolysaccharide biosynthesis polyprenyl glycosylphosphotransferase n=1 Tax=Paeniglutamicibacter cryotolerans TaxID=670079 RepID=A0A839QPR5_9MICC|nr:sugar transferase [Paeniglutamicibacter cryotolerans]MBB2995976.1 exopolysaccharide biosynthesis polyprenyl glycosylphosphotransferase [Paeniglutamicibacter cryotolerans]
MVSDASIIVMSCLAVAVLVRARSIHIIAAYTGVAMLWILLLVLCRTRSPQRIGVGSKEYKRLIDATAIVAGTTAVIAVGTGNTDLRILIFVGLPAGLACLLIERWTWRKWLWRKAREGRALSQVIVVGCASDIDYVIRQLGKNAGPAYRIVGLLSAEPAVSDTAENGIPWFSGLDQLEMIIPILGADSVIVAGPLDGGNASLKDLSWRLEKSRTQVIVVSSLTNVAGPRISVRPVEGLPLMHVDLPSFSGGHHIVKRAMDIVLSAVALLALAPLLGVLALLIKKDSKGPVIFAQERIGTNGQSFKMFKLRSMVVNAEEELERLQSKNQGSGLLFKLQDDPRVTKVGAWLRKFSLDELPQIYNVLRGDMSLVGPRPPLPKEVAKYEGHVGRRLYIKPGLTGLWQVSGRSDLDWEEGVRLDLYYVENWSVTGDLMIMWRTFKVMLHPVGAY